ncbi:MAG: beta-lactamase family protein [Myxococcales bacterium]|nr:beta-lactamase family protein [Myxococcales bacterium]
MMRWLFVLPLFVMAGCGGDDNLPSPEPEPNEFEAFDAAVEAFLADQGLSGATAVIATEAEGIVHMQAYGDFTLDRVTLLASASKIVSVGVLMHLADEGLLDIDAPISTYLGGMGDKGSITVAQLLSNSSGLVGLLPDPTYGPYVCQFLGTGTLSDCAEAIYSTEDDAADRALPDTEFRYGGAQWQLAGGIAEAASGKPWAQLVDEIYVAPCGLSNSGYNNHFVKAAGQEDPFAYPQFFDGDLDVLNATSNPNIEGGMYATIEDYGKILLMHLRGGLCDDHRVLSEDAVLRMQQDRIAAAYDGTTDLDPTMPGYGLGWWMTRPAGIVSDTGAYGASPWMDLNRRYAAMFLMEGKAEQGATFRITNQRLLEEILDAR